MAIHSSLNAVQNFFVAGSNNVSNNVPEEKERPDVIATAHLVVWVARVVIGVLALISFCFPLAGLAAIATAYAAYEVTRIAQNVVDLLKHALNDPQGRKLAANRIENIFKGAPVAEWLFQYYHEQRGIFAKGIRA